MAVTGRGIKEDPFVITTYAELVDTATAVDSYIKVGNDIDISDEYPNGDMPQLIVRSYIDGDNKTISNWYTTSARECVRIERDASHDSHIHNLTFNNIYKSNSGYSFIYHYPYSSSTIFAFENCKFKGVCYGPFATLYSSASEDYKSTFNKCAFALFFKGSSGSADRAQLSAWNCNIRIQNDRTGSSGYQSATMGLVYTINSAIEINDLQNNFSCDVYFENSTIDATTTKSSSVRSYNNGTTIINHTHAPNYTAYDSKVKLVDDSDWLDISYLSSIGFNAG